MMITVYIILMVTGLIILLPYFGYKVIIRRKYLKSIKHRFVPPEPESLQGKNPRIWTHAVSVGEVEAAHPIVRKMREEFPDLGLMVSTVTETGQSMAATKVSSADLIFYFPLDLPVIVPFFFDRLQPDLILLTETEIWPYFIRNARKRNIPVILINGRISEKSFRWYKRVRFFLEHTLRDMEIFLMQSAMDAERIMALGAPPDKVINVGNIKYDQVIHIRDNVNSGELYIKFGVPDNCRIVVAGSTHSGEENIFIESITALEKQCDTFVFPVIAPRHPDRVPEIEEVLKKHNARWVKRSEYKPEARKNLYPESGRAPLFYILDTIGELAQFYAIADVVFVGGSLVPVGGHNILEPAAFGIPVCFGPHMENFSEIRSTFLAENAGKEVHNVNDLTGFLKMMIQDKDTHRQMGEKALGIVEKNRGATQKTIDVIKPWIRKRSV